MAIRLSSIFRVKDVGFVVNGAIQWELITSDKQAVVNRGYIIDTSGGPVTLTLPPNMSLNDVVGVKDMKGSFSTNNVTIARNGHKIQNIDDDFICDVDNMSCNFTYSDISTGVVILNGGW